MVAVYFRRLNRNDLLPYDFYALLYLANDMLSDYDIHVSMSLKKLVINKVPSGRSVSMLKSSLPLANAHLAKTAINCGA